MIDIETATAGQLYNHMQYMKRREYNRERGLAYAREHREERKQYAREYRRTHKETYCATQKRYRDRVKIKKETKS